VCVEVLQGGQTSKSFEGVEDTSSEGIAFLRGLAELRVEEFAQEEGRQRSEPLKTQNSSKCRMKAREAQEGHNSRQIGLKRIDLDRWISTSRKVHRRAHRIDDLSHQMRRRNPVSRRIGRRCVEVKL
jgi:hypothetical protein